MLKKYFPAVLAFMFVCAGFSQDYSTFRIPENLKKSADAVVRTHDVKVEILRQDKMIVEETRAVTIFNEDGLKSLDAYVHYNNSIAIQSVKARVYDKNGQELTKFKQKDFKDVSAVDNISLYSDSRVIYLDYTPVSYPFTFEFYTKKATPNTLLLPRHAFVAEYDLGVEHTSYELIYDPGLMTVRYKLHNADQLGVEVSHDPGLLKTEASGIQAVKYEDYAPDSRKVLPYLNVMASTFHYEGVDGQADSWSELGKWQYDNLISGGQEISPETKAEVLTLVRGMTDVYEKSKAIYEYLQRSTRYINVSIGIGGYKPIAAIDVDETKYGDCKGLTNYMQALLKVAGIESFYTRVYAEANTPVDMDEDFMSMTQTNHIILAIPYNEGYLWADCTSENNPFNFLGSFTDNRKVLLISENGGEMVTTPAYLNEDNLLHTRANCILDENGGLQFEATRNAGGLAYEKNAYKWETTQNEDERREWYHSYWSYLNGFQLESCDYEMDKEEVMLTEHIKGAVSDYMSKAGDQYLLNTNVFNRRVPLPDRYRSRKLPFRVKRGYAQEDEVTFIIPENFAVENFALPVSLETEFGTYTMSCLPGKDGEVNYKRSFLLKHGEYPKEKYKEFREFLKSVRSYDNAKLLLVTQGAIAERQSP